MDVSWEDLRLFLAVADAGSMSRAARVLGLGQPTLSRRIAILEATAEQQLFARHTSGVTLTAAGTRLLPTAQRMAEWANEAKRALAGAEAAPEGRVRLAAPPGVASSLLAPLAAGLRIRAPRLFLDVLVGIEYVSLMRGEADLALRWRSPKERDLVVLAEMAVRPAAFASSAYVLRLRRGYEIGDIDWISWAAPYDHLPPNPQLAAAVPGYRPVFTSNDFLVQLAALEAGVGAMVLAPAVGRFSPAGKLAELSIDLGPQANTTLYLVAARRMVDVPRVRLIADAIATELCDASRPQ